MIALILHLGPALALLFLGMIGTSFTVRLRVLHDSDSQERDFVLDGDNLITIGRSDCDLVIADQHLSRRHCYLVISDGIVRIVDNRSMNGIWVNRKRVSASELRQGDEVALGATTIEVIELRGEQQTVFEAIVSERTVVDLSTRVTSPSYPTYASSPTIPLPPTDEQIFTIEPGRGLEPPLHSGANHTMELLGDERKLEIRKEDLSPRTEVRSFKRPIFESYVESSNPVIHRMSPTLVAPKPLVQEVRTPKAFGPNKKTRNVFLAATTGGATLLLSVVLALSGGTSAQKESAGSKRPEALAVGPAKLEKGESFLFYTAVNQNGSTRQGDFALHVEDRAGDVVRLFVEGTLAGKKTGFRQTLRIDSDDVKTLSVDADSADTQSRDFAQLVELLVRHQQFLKPIAIKGVETRIAGKSATHVKMAPRPKRAIASADAGSADDTAGLLEYAVSKDVFLPVMIRGTDSRNRFGYVVQLQGHSK